MCEIIQGVSEELSIIPKSSWMERRVLLTPVERCSISTSQLITGISAEEISIILFKSEQKLDLLLQLLAAFLKSLFEKREWLLWS